MISGKDTHSWFKNIELPLTNKEIWTIQLKKVWKFWNKEKDWEQILLTSVQVFGPSVSNIDLHL